MIIAILCQILIAFLPLAFAPIGGIKSKPFEFPWTATIKYKGEHFCGGVMLSPSWLMTTAQCNADWMDQEDITIEVHRHNFTKSLVDEDSTVLTIVNTTNHPQYGGDDGYWVNDLSLWQVAVESTSANSNISTWTSWPFIDEGEWSRSGTNASLYGWGEFIISPIKWQD